METVELKSKHRKETGKEHNKKIRREGRIPAVVYGPEKDTLSLDVDEKEFIHVLHTGGENVIIKLLISDGKEKGEESVIIKEIQQDPVTDRIYHIDFHVISLTEKIEVKVPLHEKGECPGVEKEGGVLDHVHREVEVKCLPTEIPARLDVDISGLNIGDSLHARDIIMPPNVELLLDPEEVIISVHAPRIEEEEEEVAEEGEEAAEPEVIEKGKKAEEAEAETEKKAEPKPQEEAKAKEKAKEKE